MLTETETELFKKSVKNYLLDPYKLQSKEIITYSYDSWNPFILEVIEKKDLKAFFILYFLLNTEPHQDKNDCEHRKKVVSYWIFKLLAEDV